MPLRGLSVMKVFKLSIVYKQVGDVPKEWIN